MTFIRPDALGIPRVERVPMYAQARFKYHIYVDGREFDDGYDTIVVCCITALCCSSTVSTRLVFSAFYSQSAAFLNRRHLIHSIH